MIGPTGVGKTEISRRLARLAGAPFIKVEATKFTEVGYVGRDVESIVRDLVEVAIGVQREKKRADVKDKAHARAEERVLDALVGEASERTRESFLAKLRAGELDEREIELDIRESQSSQTFEIPGAPGSQIGMINLSDILGKGFGMPAKRKRIKVKDAYAPLVAEESDNLIEEDALVRDALDLVQNDGIVFLDEIDKIARNADAGGRGGADVSREGVQRDLLPLIEGATVATKHGPVKTDHILFIASGAFHLSKPSDLLPELQGRLPIRVELEALTRDDLKRILLEPEASLIKQYQALMAAEGVTLEFTDDAVDALADAAAQTNASIENIGARRLATIMERILEDLSFSAEEKKGSLVTIDAAHVNDCLAEFRRDTDLAKFIL